ncbi:DUF4170 domain-containing protein [Microvirga aerophila]|jgi:hypothetical protein|uniref:DUF4170 domain-containing protein n=1 Tax=Microvirga aerophila TaxID=670291 RepID=A0A512BWS4_9HYPH|nr:hypothetical protein [Microvirga aerophila]GEO16410.1 hypothetical protein MAE02_41060 [Microvirga aerophila]
MNKTRFWVVGGEYTSCDCDTLISGTERVVGPFESRTDAEQTWRSLSEDHRPQAQVRFTIAHEPSMGA